ncbi:MAG: DUF4010 domain-containing protein [Sandaracinus sp.]
MQEIFERTEMRIAVALIVGLVIGAEREQRLAESPTVHRSAGIRTFAIVALLGAVAMLLEEPYTLAVLGAGVVAAAMVAYALGDRTDPGLTSEVALALTFALGALAIRSPQIALAVGIVTALLLAFRQHIHDVVKEVLSPVELRDALIVAGAFLVALPLLPDRAIDPFGVINPFVLWRLVALILAIHLGAHVARRILGARWGMAIAGLASGFVSSTATIAAMGAEAKKDPAHASGALSAATASTVGTFVQMAILVTAASPELGGRMTVPLGAGGVAAALVATFFARRATAMEGEQPKKKESAVDLKGAAFFALLVTGASLVSLVGRSLAGDMGAVIGAVIASLADAHAAAASVGSLFVANAIDADLAVLGVLACLSTNSVTKIVVAFGSGDRDYGTRISVATTAVLGAAWAGWAFWPR